MTTSKPGLIWAARLALTVAWLASPQLSDATPAKTACVRGSQACPAIVRMKRGAVSALVKGKVSEANPIYFLKFSARAGQILTVDPVEFGGIKWGAGVPIAFPGGKDGDAVDPGEPFKLPKNGTYVLELHVNRMADDAFGPFSVKVTIKSTAQP